LHHPDLPPRLSALAVRGVSLATGWSLDTWRERVDRWSSGTMAGDDLVKRLPKLRSFLETARRESRHLSESAADDPDAREIFGEAGQGVVTAALEWFAAPPEAAAVMVTNVAKRYDEVQAVAGVSLTIPRGQVFGLLGPNSAGKTTLIECIEGIRTPDAGSISVLGRAPGAVKARIGVQLQKTGFYDLLTLRETLNLYAAFYPRPVSVVALMDRLQIRDKAKTLVKDLSGGILQRLSLGVALVNDPELVFLDEPTTGLDPQARHVIWDIVRSLRDEGRTVVLTTHYMEEAEQLCDRVAIMTAGSVRAQGAPGELIGRHVGESIVEIGPDNGVSDLPGVRRHVLHGGRLLLQADDPPGLLSALLAGPRPPADARLRRGTLEDVFLTIASEEPSL
jgi:ABC-2 type transport system ATP-binding protein